MYRVYDPAKLQVFISRKVRFGSPLVGEENEETNLPSETDDNTSSDSTTATHSEEDGEQKPVQEQGREE